VSTVSERILCHGGTGTIKGEALGGQPPYLYSIDGIQPYGSDNVFSSLSEGVYQIYVKDNLGSVKTLNMVELKQPSPITVDVSRTFYDIVVTATGGVGNFLYSKDNLVFEQGDTILDPGNGLVNVYAKDENGCTSSDTITIDIPQLVAVVEIKNDIKCNGQKAMVSVTPNGGFPPYKYSTTGTSYQGSPNFSINAGTYQLIVLDNGGKKILTQEITTNDPTPIVITFTNDRYDVTALVTGGTPPYTYGNNGFNFSPDSLVVFPGNGAYKLYAKDAQGCTKSVNLALNYLTGATVNITKPTCFGKSDGKIKLTADGGQVPYLYSLDGATFSEKREWFNLAGGPYKYSIIDNRSDTINGEIALSSPDSLTINVSVAGNTLLIEASGGTPEYNYSIDDDVYIAGNIFNDLPNGNYSVSVKDKNGCITKKSVFLNSTTDGSENDKIIVYPNPTTGLLTVDVPDNIGNNLDFEVYDLLGSIVYKKTFEKTSKASIAADLTSLMTGQYVLRIKSPNKIYHKLVEIIK
jgi:large repetitive protein